MLIPSAFIFARPIQVSGECAINLGGAGDLMTGSTSISGTTCAIAISGAGNLRTSIALSGGAGIAVGGSGDLRKGQQLSGTCAISIGGSGDLKVSASLSGASPIAVAGSGDLRISQPLAGTCPITIGGAAQCVWATGLSVTNNGGGGAWTVGTWRLFFLSVVRADGSYASADTATWSSGGSAFLDAGYTNNPTQAYYLRTNSDPPTPSVAATYDGVNLNTSF